MAINDSKKEKEEVAGPISDDRVTETNLLAAIVRSSYAEISAIDFDGIVLVWNKGSESLFGYTAGEMLGKSVKIIYPENRTNELEDIISKIKNGESVDPHLTQRIRKDGKTIDVAISASPIINDGGKIIGVSIISRPFAGQERVEQYAHSIIEASLDPFVTINTEGKVMDVNEATIKVTGADRKELIGADFFNYFTEPEKAREGYQRVFKEGSVTNYPLTIHNKAGKLIDVLFNASVYKDDAGNVLGVSAIARDVTESNKILFYARSVIEAGLDPMITISPEGKITDVNEATVNITGVPREKIIGSMFNSYFTDSEEAIQGREQVFREGFVREYPLTIRHASGSLTDVLYNASVYKDDKGNVFGAIAAVRDVTAQKKVEEKLHETSAYSQSLIEASLDPLFIISPEGKITGVNSATEGVTGVTRAWLIDTDFYTYFTEPHKAQAGYRQVLKDGLVRDYSLSIHNVSGKVTDVSFNASVYKDAAGIVRGIFAVARDVTETKKISQYARSLIEASLDPLVTISPEGKVTDVNEATIKVTGVSREKLIGTDFLNYFTEPQKAHDGYEKVFKLGFVTDYPLTIRSQDGKLTDVLFNASVYKDEKGNVLGVFAAARDNTRAKQATELIESTNKELKSLDVAKDEFVSIASHQLRTPLTALKGYTGMLLDGDPGPINDKQREYLLEIRNANNRMINLITALLNTSRVDLGVFVVEPEPVNFEEVAQSILKELESNIKDKKLHMQSNFEKGLPLISADPKITRMIFQNLLSNAVKYTPPEGSITLNLKKDASNFIISVTDTGYGIPEAVQSKIFAKLFRADNARKQDPQGTGLGLYIVKATIEATGGKIWFESKENHGSTFYVSIPLEGMKKKEGTKRLE